MRISMKFLLNMLDDFPCFYLGSILVGEFIFYISVIEYNGHGVITSIHSPKWNVLFQCSLDLNSWACHFFFSLSLGMLKNINDWIQNRDSESLWAMCRFVARTSVSLLRWWVGCVVKRSTPAPFDVFRWKCLKNSEVVINANRKILSGL